MSSNKRPFDRLGAPDPGDPSKRSKSSAPQPSNSSSNNLSQANLNPISVNQPFTQPCTQPSQAGASSQGQNTGHAMMSTLRKSMRFLKKSCGVVPILDSAVATLLEPLELMEVANQVDEELRDVASDLPRWAALLSSYLSDVRPEQLSKWIEQLADDLVKQAEDIRALQQRGRMRRITDSQDEMEILRKCYGKIETSFRQFQTDVELKTWWTADDLLKKSQLQDLNPTHDARFDSTFSHDIERGECLANTRVSVLEGIRAWIRGDIDAKVHWTNGMAGTGKTTIAYTICAELERDKRLGASFFCSRASSDCRDVGRILPTIAYQLAQLSYPFRSSLCRILDKHPNIGQRNISMQFDYLIHTPMLEVEDLLPNGLVIVIDALDECSNPKAVDMMLGAVFRHAVNLPVRFFLTSRPEPSITKTVLSRDNQSRSILHLHNVEEQFVKADIETYLTVKLSGLLLDCDQIKQLAERSGILFIYAATVARYLLETGSSAYAFARLRSILTQGSQTTTIITRDIDVLYRTILDGVFSGRLERDEMELTRRVLWTVVCACEPMTKGTLAIMLDADHSMVTAALQLLQSVLHVSESSEVVSTLHASFPEFLLGFECCGEMLRCNGELHHEFMAKRCFEVMAEKLRFNICRLETSSRYDKDVPDLDERVKAFISAELTYACRYWSSHLSRSCFCDKLLTFLNELLEVRLLFWMEVLNLTGWMSNARNILSEADEWLSVTEFTNVSELVKEAYSFVTTFAANSIRQSTPHIYISALALHPKQSRVWRIYSKRTQGLIAVDGTLSGQRGRVTKWTVDRKVTSMAYSSDGSRIVLGTGKGEIHIMDVYTGTPLGGPFETHSGEICSVALSPDNSLVAFGSHDGAARVLYASTGIPFHSPFVGHTGVVGSVVFSPDGTQIASGSCDGTIRVWDVRNGTLVRDPFDCHTSNTNCIAFSPDGALVASACGDSRVQVWEIRSGSLSFPPLEGHATECLSVAFSSDGRRIVSGSSDGVVKVWNINTRASVSGAVSGEGQPVISVGFTPDGSRILSASRYPMVEVWDANCGTLIASCSELVTGESGYDCVAFSPNGTRAAGYSWDYNHTGITLWEAGSSASKEISFRPDHTHTRVALSPDFSRLAITACKGNEFCILDSRTGVPIRTSFKGQTGQILGLVFSPNGSRITSVSQGCAVREWDVCSGTLISRPFAGIDTWHREITYTPDGIYLLALGGDDSVRLWDIQQGRLVNTVYLGPAITLIALSPDGTHVASGSGTGMIQLWDMRSGAVVGDPFGRGSGRIESIVFSSNGALVAVGDSDAPGAIEVWEVQTGNLVSRMVSSTNEHTVFLPGDSRIASASSRGVNIWEIDSGALAHTISEGDFGFIECFRHLIADAHLGLFGCFLDFSVVWRFPLYPQSQSLLPRILHINEYEWVLDPSSRAPIFWLPAELRGGCNRITTPNTLIILPSGTFSFDFSNVLMGESWEQCYSS